MSDPMMLTGVPLALFMIVGTIAIASSILVVSMRNPVHSALFLLLTFLCVAIFFVMLGAEFVGAVQVLVYAGGIMVLFLFVVMLINVKALPTERVFTPGSIGGVMMGILLFLILAIVLGSGKWSPRVNEPDNVRSTTTVVTAPVTDAGGVTVQTETSETTVVGNSEAVGMALYRDYLVPFEVASLFLLVAMIGAIVIGKRDLNASEEESIPDFVAKKVADEERIKGVTGA
ncbi:MAG: NADH-quinone oxidoreductase subunit J [Thermoanaerobaculia bacterium]|nr:NADH-quinone oxidoreductase subunit J [Thermoanaerobaculia bacterium]